jgi:hypothetical protein
MATLEDLIRQGRAPSRRGGFARTPVPGLPLANTQLPEGMLGGQRMRNFLAENVAQAGAIGSAPPLQQLPFDLTAVNQLGGIGQGGARRSPVAGRPLSLAEQQLQMLQKRARSKAGIPGVGAGVPLEESINVAMRPGLTGTAFDEFITDDSLEASRQQQLLRDAQDRTAFARARQAGTVGDLPTGGTPAGSLLPAGIGATGETRGRDGGSNFLSPQPSSNLAAALARDEALNQQPLGETGAFFQRQNAEGQTEVVPLAEGQRAPRGSVGGLGVGLLGPGDETKRKELQAERRAARRGARHSLEERIAEVSRRGKRRGEMQDLQRQGLSPLQSVVFGGGVEGLSDTEAENIRLGALFGGDILRSKMTADATVAAAKERGATDLEVANIRAKSDRDRLNSDREFSGFPPISEDGTVEGEPVISPVQAEQRISDSFGAEETKSMVDSITSPKGGTRKKRAESLAGSIDELVSRGIDMNQIASIIRGKITPQMREDIQTAIGFADAPDSLVEIAARLGIEIPRSIDPRFLPPRRTPSAPPIGMS